MALKIFANDKSNTQIRIITDNSTAVSAINHMGTSHSHPCNFMAKETWESCLERNIWISVPHIPSTQNFLADIESHNQKEAEWMLMASSPQDALNELDFPPAIDMFESRINTQFPNMCPSNPTHPPLL